MYASCTSQSRKALAHDRKRTRPHACASAGSDCAGSLSCDVRLCGYAGISAAPCEHECVAPTFNLVHGGHYSATDAILSALSAAGLVVEQDWQPIETAPHHVEIWLADYTRVNRGWWDVHTDTWFMVGGQWPPTHWRPKPNHPEIPDGSVRAENAQAPGKAEFEVRAVRQHTYNHNPEGKYICPTCGSRADAALTCSNDAAK